RGRCSVLAHCPKPSSDRAFPTCSPHRRQFDAVMSASWITQTIAPSNRKTTQVMFAIAPTDLDWFARIRIGPTDRIVNFWTPTPWGVKGLRPDDRLYFMLKAPIRRIGGYGAFVRYVDATAAEAWQMYGLSNGVDSENELVKKIAYFAERRSQKFTPS